MLGSLLKAAVKTVTLPVDIAIDVVAAPMDIINGDDVGNRTNDKINGIADNLDDIKRGTDFLAYGENENGDTVTTSIYYSVSGHLYYTAGGGEAVDDEDDEYMRFTFTKWSPLLNPPSEDV